MCPVARPAPRRCCTPSPSSRTRSPPKTSVIVTAGASMAGEELVDTAPEQWVAALTRARDELGCTFFDWLTAVDELEDGFSVVAHVWSISDRRHQLLRTRVPRDEPRLATATGVYRGANWHERETYEMFGIEFTGHPNLVRLL